MIEQAERRSLLACPRCLGSLAELKCVQCGTQYEGPNGIPRLLLPVDSKTEQVRRFYEAAPFPGYSQRDDFWALRARGQRSDFARQLDAAIPARATVLELGCGTGQMSLFLANRERRVVGVDLARASLQLAAEAARNMGVRGVLFVETDLRRPGLRTQAFDVVCCLGVLHHTPDPAASFACLPRLVKPGGFAVVGLYNTFARFPHRVRRGLSRATGFRWFPMDPVLAERSADPARRDAWIRDQYRHPEEHRHTVREVRHWFAQNGIQYLRTFPPSTLDGSTDPSLFSAAEDSWTFEEWLAQLGWMATLWREGGLFIAIGQAPPAAEAPTARPPGEP